MTTYAVTFAGKTYTRKTEAVYLYAAYRPTAPAFTAPVTFHKTYTAAAKKAGAFGDVKPVEEV